MAATEWVSSKDASDMQEGKRAFGELSELFKRWNLQNAHRPFDKNVVSVLGLTSSGKSSLINFFFGMVVKKAAQREVDTHFTLVETVPEGEFAQLVPGYRRRAFEPEASTAATVADPARNIAYTVLDIASTLARYQQFESFEAVFRKHQLLEAVIINEAYLNPAPQPNDVRTKTILIDSPGFTAETDAGKLEGNLKVLQFIYQLSQLTLFLIPADSLALVSGQIHLLELSLIYTFHGADRVNQTIEAHKQAYGKQEFLVTSFYGIIASQLGLSWGQSGSSGSSRDPRAGAATDYIGSSHWERVRFVMTKMDRVAEPGKRRGAGSEAAFYELGVMLASSLKSMRAPVFDQCMAISLPGHTGAAAPGAPAPSTGDLRLLLGEISALNLYNSFSARLESAIQKMCDELNQAMEKTVWSYVPLVGSTDKATVARLLAESQKRSRSRLQGGTTSSSSSSS